MGESVPGVRDVFLAFCVGVPLVSIEVLLVVFEVLDCCCVLCLTSRQACCPVSVEGCLDGGIGVRGRVVGLVGGVSGDFVNGGNGSGVAGVVGVLDSVSDCPVGCIGVVNGGNGAEVAGTLGVVNDNVDVPTVGVLGENPVCADGV